MSADRPHPRRVALRQLLLTALTLAAGRARSAELPHLAEADPQAVKLGYKEDATHIDKSKFSSFDPVQRCENCVQLQGDAGPAYRPCQLFPGKAVAVKGWCSGWTPEI